MNAGTPRLLRRRRRAGFTPLDMVVEVATAGVLTCAAGGALELPGPAEEPAIQAVLTRAQCTGSCGATMQIDPIALFGPAAAETGVVLATEAGDWSARATLRGDGTVRIIAADATAAAEVWHGSIPAIELAKLAAVQAAGAEATPEEIAARAWTLSLKRRDLVMTAAIHDGDTSLVSGSGTMGGWPQTPVVLGEVRSAGTADGAALSAELKGAVTAPGDNWAGVGCTVPVSAVAEATGPDLTTLPPSSGRRRTARAASGGPNKSLLYAGLGTVAAGGALYVLSAVERNKFDNTDTAYEDLDTAKTLTNASFAGAVVLGVAGASLSGMAFMTVSF